MGGQLHGAQELMVRRFAISSENKKGARERVRGGWLGPRVILKGVDSACEEQNQRFISAYREASERAFRGERKKAIPQGVASAAAAGTKAALTTLLCAI
jgi:hypothetical protein